MFNFKKEKTNKTELNLELTEEEVKKLKIATENAIVFHKDEEEEFFLKRRDFGLSLFMESFKKIILNSEYSFLIFKHFYKSYKNHIDEDKLIILSPEVTGTILATSISSYCFSQLGKKIPHIFSRLRRKKYGEEKVIEGEINDVEIMNKKIVIVDDIFNSGSRSISALSNLSNAVEIPINLLDYEFYCFFLKKTENVPSNLKSFFQRKDINLGFSEFQIKKRNKNVKYEIIDGSRIKWKIQKRTTNNWGVPKSSPLVCEKTGFVFFGTDSDGMIAANQDTGVIEWAVKSTYAKKGIISSPREFQENYIIYGDYGGNINIVEKKTGYHVFKEKVCDYIGSTPCVIDNNSIAIGLEREPYEDKQQEKNNGSDFSIEYNPKKQKGGIAEFKFIKNDLFERFSLIKKWEIFLPEYQHSSPEYSKEKDLIITGSNFGLLLSINRKGISPRQEYIGSPMKSSAAIKGNIAVIGAFNGIVYFWNFETGKIVSEFHTDDIIYSKPLIHEDKCYIGTGDGQFVTFSMKEGEEGKVLNSFFIGDKIHCAPSIFNERIYCGASNGFLFRTDFDGNLDKVFVVGERLVCRPAFNKNGDAFILNNLNTIKCFSVLD